MVLRLRSATVDFVAERSKKKVTGLRLRSATLFCAALWSRTYPGTERSRSWRFILRRGFFYDMNSFFKRYLTPAVKWILFINVGILLLQATVLQMAGLNNLFMNLFSQMPYFAVRRFQIWRFFTYMFLHGGGSHLIFNMIALWFFGPRLESRWGTKGFLKFYFACGVGAALVHAIYTLTFGYRVIYHDEIVRGMIPMIGASGAIYGILLAFALYWPDQPVYLYMLIPMKIKYVMILFGVIEFINTIGASGSNISHITHLGGLVTAFIYLKGWRMIKMGRGGGFFKRGPKKVVKRYYRDSEGRIYYDFDG
jgi:rhomboid family protein